VADYLTPLEAAGLDRPSRIEVLVEGDKVEIVGRCVVTARGFLMVMSD
jgi:hypothetical protein